MKVKLSDYCRDASPAFEGVAVNSNFENEIHDDCVYKKLLKETSEEFDIMAQQSLKVIFHSFLIILERECVDQLPGGKYWNPSENVLKSSANVPTENKASE